ncbi:MAG: hypothetical protein IKR71_06890 [Bacteroidales bacterium]|nr:hypothetical protein [Bacteroidales bacterium]
MEFRLYNQLNCTFFDILGKKEPAQTKAVGFLLSHSRDSMKALLSLVYVNDKRKVNNLLGYDWIVHCEQPQIPEKTHQKRSDIVIGFYDGIKPVHAIIIEAKTIMSLTSDKQTVNQLAVYKNSYALKQFTQNTTSLVSLTSVKEMSFSTKAYSSLIGHIHSITWEELIAALEGAKKPDKVFFIHQFTNYLKRLSIMKQYDKEILCIPAGNTLSLIQKYWLYECPTVGRQYKRRGQMRPLYLAFRKSRSNGRFDTLYKVQDVVAIDMNDNNAVNALENQKKYPDIKNRIQGYVAECKPTGLKWVFILDKDNSIKLPFPVEFEGNTKGMSGHIDIALKDVIVNPCPGVVKIKLKKDK